MARRGREYEDAWGGFDAGQTVYNPKEEKSYESLVWKYVAGIVVIALLVVIYMHFTELYVIRNGNCITAEYETDEYGSEFAWYVDENNRYYKYNVSELGAVHGETRIDLYYTDNIREAVPKTKWQIWFGYYLFFGGVLGVSLWRIIKVYKTIS